MDLSEKQIDLINRNNIVALATSDGEGSPRVIFCEVNKVDGDKLIITDNQMEKTKDNFLENKKVFLLAFENDYSCVLKISGEADYYTSGEYFDFVKDLETNKEYKPKGAILIKVSKVIESA